ncbi:nitrogen fixation protein NifQ [Methylococcus sp. EFPC2]|uniref:nitrogen fixation protein NifQ n=1 Tax=Methylococcus sp. EFPC2 TaxID=2812648 RepID=UPI001966E7C8|nr:nitrogen fixation protein NifQ [Methylococcus sp. EFPC2]QSA99288.1 nitrogen fixation protein NifQ [Methylococcus sp. EFPC2]
MLARNLNYDPLMVHARDPQDPLTLAFASAIELARSSSRLPGGFGLDQGEFSALLDAYFPGARGLYLAQGSRSSWTAGRQATDEFDDLLKLLLEHRVEDSRLSRWLAHAVAACCMGEDHLWQDLGLPNRQALSDLLARHFQSLFARNTGGMRWKKFFYKQLCERHGAFVCRSPSCAECVEYANCFGPEEDGAWQPVKR